MTQTLKPLVVVVGPTASGKTALAVRLARQFSGEIVSADSRQVYRGLDLGSGKDLGEYNYRGQLIPYHLIDVASPKTNFNVAKYQRLAYRAISGIQRRHQLPFLVGGSGLYVDAVVKGYNLAGGPVLSAVERQQTRRQLAHQSLPKLLAQLKKIDLATFRKVDRQNRRRVERAIEIFIESGVPKSKQQTQTPPPYHLFKIGVSRPLPELYERIDRRLHSRLRHGLVAEVEALRQQGVSWERLDNFGLEYRFVARYLQKELTYSEMVSQLQSAIRHFAKRQLTWFKRDNSIIWLTDAKSAANQLKSWLKGIDW